MDDTHYVAFIQQQLIASGDLLTVALALKAQKGKNTPEPLVFGMSSGRQIDLDIRGTRAELSKRYPTAEQDVAADTAPMPPARRGRPKLGVVGREVTLLPRHWQWLDSQRGGASASLRRLVDQARRDNQQQDLKRHSQDRSNRFMAAIAGDLQGFEEAARALFAGDRSRFMAEIKGWPKDIRATALRFAEDAFADS